MKQIFGKIDSLVLPKDFGENLKKLKDIDWLPVRLFGCPEINPGTSLAATGHPL